MLQDMLKKISDVASDPWRLYKEGEDFIYGDLTQRAFESASGITQAKVGIPFLGWLDPAFRALGLGTYFKNIMVFSDPELAGRVLQEGDKIPGGRRGYQRFADLFDDPDVFFPKSGQEGLEERKGVRPYFHLKEANEKSPDLHKSLSAIHAKIRKEMGCALAKAAEQDRVDLEDSITLAMLKIISVYILGSSELPDDFAVLANKMDSTLKHTSPGTSEFKEVIEEVRLACKNFISQHGEEMIVKDNYLLLLARRRLASQGCETPTNDELKEELSSNNFLAYLAAATNITQIIFSSIIEMHKQPDILKQVGQEFQKAKEAGIDLDADPAAMQTNLQKHFPYLHAVFQETLRMRAMVPALRRDFDQPQTLDYKGQQVHIPANTVAFVPIRAMSYREDLYPEPTRFMPERFMGKKPAPFPPLTFSIGARGCPARSHMVPSIYLAAIEAMLDFDIKFDHSVALQSVGTPNSYQGYPSVVANIQARQAPSFTPMASGGSAAPTESSRATINASPANDKTAESRQDKKQKMDL